MTDISDQAHSAYSFEVQWGDCDPADIVYYPNYYRWFDDACHAMFSKAGFGLASVRQQHQSLGFPLVNASAQFKLPATVGDRLTVLSRVSAIGRKSITVDHSVMRGENLLVEGREIRIMGVRDAGGRLTAGEIPAAFRAYFGFD